MVSMLRVYTWGSLAEDTPPDSIPSAVLSPRTGVITSAVALGLGFLWSIQEYLTIRGDMFCCHDMEKVAVSKCKDWKLGMPQNPTISKLGSSLPTTNYKLAGKVR